MGERVALHGILYGFLYFPVGLEMGGTWVLSDFVVED